MMIKPAETAFFSAPTILTNINADGVDVGHVGHGGPHGCTGGPHVVEEENGHGGEAENPEPGHSQDVREEHKLAGGHKGSIREPLNLRFNEKLPLQSRDTKGVKRSTREDPVVSTYHSTDAAPADGRLEFAVQLFNGAGGIKALSQEDDPVQEEKGSDAVDDVLHQLNPVKERRHQLQPSNLRSACLRVPDPSPSDTHAGRREQRHAVENSCLRRVYCHVTAGEIGLTLRFRCTERLSPNVERTGDACLWESSAKRQTVSGDVSD